MLEPLAQDARYGLRMLLKNPGLTAVAVLMLALGIGATVLLVSTFSSDILQNIWKGSGLAGIYSRQPCCTLHRLEMVSLKSPNQALEDPTAHLS